MIGWRSFLLAFGSLLPVRQILTAFKGALPLYPWVIISEFPLAFRFPLRIVAVLLAMMCLGVVVCGERPHHFVVPFALRGDMSCSCFLSWRS